MPVAVVAGLPARLRERAAVFDETGGLHAAGCFARRRLLAVAEDVGRHNAVDKVVGRDAAARGGCRSTDIVLCVSGRTSFEIVQKAWCAGIPIVAAVSAPSSLAIELAREAGITLVGFVRDGSFNIYTHPERIDVRRGHPAQISDGASVRRSADQKPRHYREMARIAWENRDQLPFAWRILSDGVCDGCALGTSGLSDWTLPGVASLHGAARADAAEHGAGARRRALSRRRLAATLVVARAARAGPAAGAAAAARAASPDFSSRPWDEALDRIADGAARASIRRARPST